MEKDFSYKFYNSTVSAWQGMYQEVLAAYKSIYWEVYIFKDDEVGNRFIDLLCDKAKQGVEVKIIIDAMGSFDLSRLAINRMRASGVEVLAFNEFLPEFDLRRWWSRVWLRTHCKVLIIDEETAFVGGVNVGYQMEKWDDLHLRLTGKVVRQLLRYFTLKYIQAGGEKKKVWHLMHPKLVGLEEWRDRVRFIVQTPRDYTSRSPLRSFYHQALAVAKESINLVTPYYVPDRKFLELIYKARRKGVRVNIIMPYKSDLKIMNYLAQAMYGLSKKAGVAFYFSKRMNHSKAISVDSSLGLVGSANVTPRGFFYNYETAVTFTDEHMVAELNNILNNWKKEADPLLELDFKRKGWFKRFKSWWVMKLRDYV